MIKLAEEGLFQRAKVCQSHSNQNKILNFRTIKSSPSPESNFEHGNKPKHLMGVTP